AALNAAACLCDLAAPVAGPSARTATPANASRGRTRASFPLFMVSSPPGSSAKRLDYRAAGGRCLVQPFEGSRQDVDCQLDVLRGGVLVGRVAHAAVQAADETHRRRGA